MRDSLRTAEELFGLDATEHLKEVAVKPNTLTETRT